jgi:signal peptidase I
MTEQKSFRQFLFPSLTPKTLARIALVALVAYIVFGHICIPFRIKGYSMEPTYTNGHINFCWTLGYISSEPARYDIVLIRFAGKKVMLLKRIVAMEGETVEFCDGKLLVDEKEIKEPYLKYPCNWNLAPRKVRKGHVYVIGDNRNMSIKSHNFGQTSINRIVGIPLW